MKLYLARVKRRVADDTGLVAVEYLGIAVLVLAVLTALIALIPGLATAIGTQLNALIDAIFQLRPN